MDVAWLGREIGIVCVLSGAGYDMSDIHATFLGVNVRRVPLRYHSEFTYSVPRRYIHTLPLLAK